MSFNINKYDRLFNKLKKPMSMLSKSKDSSTNIITYPVNINELALDGDELAIRYSKKKKCELPGSFDALTLSGIPYKLNLIEFKFINIKRLKNPNEVIDKMESKFIGMKTILIHYKIWTENYEAFYIFDIREPKNEHYLKVRILINKIENKIIERKQKNILNSPFKCHLIKTFESKIHEFKNYK